MEASNSQYYGIVQFEAQRWLHRLITEPDNFNSTLEDMASKVMCTLTWDRPEFSMYNSKSAWGLLTQMSPAGPITNVVTPLWHLPEFMNPWKKAEHKRHDEQNAFWMERVMDVRSRMEEGTQRPCWARSYAETEKSQKLSCDKEAACCIGMICLVGVFTVAGPLSYFLMAMVFHQDWLKKCQEEIDTACGGRMPTLDDYANLPILRACIKETMRWKPNVPTGKLTFASCSLDCYSRVTGVAHETEADDFYRGYFIPKGTRILPLDWYEKTQHRINNY